MNYPNSITRLSMHYALKAVRMRIVAAGGKIGLHNDRVGLA